MDKDKVIELLKEKSVKEVMEITELSKSTLYNWKNDVNQLSLDMRNKNKATQKEYNELLRSFEKISKENKVLKEITTNMKLTNQLKYSMIIPMINNYSIHVLCDAIGLKRSTYYHIHKSIDKENANEKKRDELEQKVIEIFKESKERLGADKIRHKLRDRNIKVSKKTVSEIMKRNNLVPLYCRKYKKTYPKRDYYKNKVKGDFSPSEPNRIWVSDITYIHTLEGVKYLAVIIDLYSRKVIAYSLEGIMDNLILIKMLNEVYKKRGSPQKLIFHSDQGSQYTSHLFREFLSDIGIDQSFSSPGSPLDNAVAERFFASIKREQLYSTEITTYEQCAEMVTEYINYFNHERPHNKLENLTPQKFEDIYFNN